MLQTRPLTYTPILYAKKVNFNKKKKSKHFVLEHFSKFGLNVQWLLIKKNSFKTKMGRKKNYPY